MRAAYALQGAAFLLLIIVAGVLLMRSAHAPPSQNSSSSIISSSTKRMETATTLTLASPVFEDATRIPSKYTCDGQDISPELHISGVPDGTQSLVLIVDDPDSPTGTWDHWIVFNISPTTTLIKEGTEPGGVEVGVGGTNTFGKTGYGGPCPGQGEHHYVFKLYALDAMLNLQEGATKKEIETAMEGHILAETKLVGLYKKVAR